MAQENDRQWHQLSAAEALSQLDASASGLTPKRSAGGSIDSVPMCCGHRKGAQRLDTAVRPVP